MERSQEDSWIQVIGPVAVHRPGRESHKLTGATRVLLSILIAAGPDGASIEEIADCYWNQTRPASWKIALRVSASHLSAQLPDGWDITVRDNWFRLAPGSGFVDVWRIDELHEATDQDFSDIDWVGTGDVFDGVVGVKMVDDAALRLAPRIHTIRNIVGMIRAAGGSRPANPDELLINQVRHGRRVILIAPGRRHANLAQAVIADTLTDTHIVVGDRRILLPLGPFAMTFPELRTEIRLEQGVVEQGSATRAFRIVADSLAAQAIHRPQRLVIANAHELDTKSLKLTSFLIDQGRLSDFAMVVCADSEQRDIRWLDFVRRSVTAGCELIEVDPT